MRFPALSQDAVGAKSSIENEGQWRETSSFFKGGRGEGNPCNSLVCLIQDKPQIVQVDRLGLS